MDRCNLKKKLSVFVLSVEIELKYTSIHVLHTEEISMPGRVRGQQLAACRKQEGTSHFLLTKTFGDKQTEAREKSKPEITSDLLSTETCIG